MSNCDSNILLRVLLRDNNQQVQAYKKITSEGNTIRSDVLCEVMNVAYRVYKMSEGIAGPLSLHHKDKIRSRLVAELMALYTEGANFQDSGVLVCALLIYKYRRLDWVDSWLLARKVVLGEGIVTYDEDLLRNADIMASNGNRIPVISSYTQPLDDMPPRVFIQDKDVRHFVEAGLLHIKPPDEEHRAKYVPASKGITGMNLFGKR